jgi:hypothetical protein
MANITASSQRSPLQYSRKDYAYITMSADQNTNISDTNPVKFNTLTAGNITFDPATYTATLKANKTYVMRSALGNVDCSAAGYVGISFYNVTTSTAVGSRAFYYSTTYTGHTASGTVAIYTITTTVDTAIKVILTSPNNLTKLYALYSWVEIEEIDTYTPAVYGGQYAYVSPQFTITVTLADWTTARAKATFYKTNNGIWYMQFNIKGAMASSARKSISLVISDVVFYNGSEFQSISADCNAVTAITAAQARTNSGVLDIYHANATTTKYCTSGFVELNAKPTVAGIPADQ